MENLSDCEMESRHLSKVIGGLRYWGANTTISGSGRGSIMTVMIDGGTGSIDGSFPDGHTDTIAGDSYSFGLVAPFESDGTSSTVEITV